MALEQIQQALGVQYFIVENDDSYEWREVRIRMRVAFRGEVFPSNEWKYLGYDGWLNAADKTKVFNNNPKLFTAKEFYESTGGDGKRTMTWLRTKLR